MKESFMQHSERENNLFHRLAGKAGLLGGVLMAFLIAGCGGSTTKQTSTTTSTPQTYFAPYVAGTTYYYGTSASLETPLTYTMDDTAGAGTFSQTAYGLPSVPGSQVLNAGVLSVGQSGLRNLSMETYYVSNNNVNAAYIAETYIPFQPAFALELADQTGGLVQLHGQPVAPLVAATQCPNFTTSQTYQFLTIPSPLRTAGTAGGGTSWDPTAETAYGSVDISSSGSTVTLKNINQYILPSEGGTAISGSSSATGACGSTSYGYITDVPGQLVITDPGNGQIVPAQAKIGIGANSGLLVEDDNATGQLVSTSGKTVSPYNKTLGAGTGTVGLLKPSSALSTSAVIGAQYLGFIYGAGVYNLNPGLANSSGWTSHLASFNYSSTSSGCASLAAQTGPLSNGIYGGDYTNDDPTTYTSSNCDFAIDLGAAQTSNGLYTNATVWMGANYAANTTGKAYSFKAVAIAGQIDKKNAIFVLGVDSTQPWAIYLLQSN
jgi:hypothetical protein